MTTPSEDLRAAAKEVRGAIRSLRIKISDLAGRLLDPNNGMDSQFREKLAELFIRPATNEAAAKLSDYALTECHKDIKKMFRSTDELLKQNLDEETKSEILKRRLVWSGWYFEMMNLMNAYGQEADLEAAQMNLEILADSLEAAGQ